jgi:CDP-4-dehydro-6-deoxyglucose reductase, E3
VRISVGNTGRVFEAGAQEPILDAALRAGFNLPHSCKGGNCGSCRVRLLQGQIEYPTGTPLGLSAGEIAEGLVLLCRAYARSDVSIDIAEIRSAEESGPKRLPCRIERLIDLAHDVKAVFLRLPAAEPFRFEAGQYLDVLLPGGRRRSFSIASPPHDARPLELHVRKVAGGLFSESLFQQLGAGALLSIEGPLGNFRYRDAAKPLLLVAGGTGLAPLKSIFRHVLENQIARPVTLYVGARARRDLYEHPQLTELAQTSGQLRYIPVLSEPDADWNGRRGFVHAAVMADIERLVDYDIYSAGPPVMIESLRRDFLARGADPAQLQFDSFEYASDRPAAAPLK